MSEYPDCCLRHQTNGPRGGSCGSLAYTGPEATPDPLATVPAEERIRIRRLADDAWKMAVGHGPEPERQRQDVIRREVAAWLPLPPDARDLTRAMCSLVAEIARAIRLGEKIPVVRADQLTALMGRWKDAVLAALRSMPPSTGTALPVLTADRLTEDELRGVEARTSGPGPLAGDGPVMRRLAAEVRALRAERDAAQTTIERLRRQVDDAENDAMHAQDELAARPAPAAYSAEDIRDACKRADVRPEVLLALMPRRSAPAADASLEARAHRLAVAFWSSHPAEPILPWADLDEAERRAWLAAAAVDASRPALTKEQARQLAEHIGIKLGLAKDGDEEPVVTATRAILGWCASRGEAPPAAPRATALGSMAPGVIAEASRAVHAPSAELLRERWIDAAGTAHTSNCSGQPDANGRCYCGAVQPLPAGLTCPGCYAETGVAQPHREAPPRCPGYAAHVTARPEDTSAPAPGPAPACCSRAGEYNGFGSDGPTSFTCPATCGCHD